MKKLIFGFLLLTSAAVKAQTITDTGALRAYINAHIVTNNTHAITAQQLNGILNGYLNVWPNDSLSYATGLVCDTLIFWKGNRKSITIPCKKEAVGVDTLLPAGSMVTWDMAKSRIATTTIGDTVSLRILNLAPGTTGTLIVHASIGTGIVFPIHSYQIADDIYDSINLAWYQEKTVIGKVGYNSSGGIWLCKFIFDGFYFFWDIKRAVSLLN